MGIGGDDSWGAKTPPEYLLKADEPMKFTFTFQGI
jgi:beta-galactosidase